jgi:SWI/SNF-related matrix-associated actin-dependent regulator 1 of chromatin subfamily A
MDDYKIIHDASKYLYELNKSYIEWDEDESFLDSKSLGLLKIIYNVHSSKISTKIIYSCWLILNKYKDYLDIDFNEVPEPEYTIEEVDEETDNKFSFKNGIILLKNITPCFQELLNKNQLVINNTVEITPSLIIKVIEFYSKKLLSIDIESKKQINIYLNSLGDTNFEKVFEDKELKVVLKPFQEVGVAFLMLNKKALLGDEMGLGKTVQSISAIELTKSYPALIVAPVTLKYGWKKEIERFTNRKVSIIGENCQENSDYYIVNYESLHKYKDVIKKRGIKSIVFDESHHLKNSDAKRTMVASEISKGIEYRFALTGTAVLKCPYDLLSQIKIIGKIECFENDDKFIENFCRPKNSKYNFDKNGSSNLYKLSKIIRENFFLRRTKKEVLKYLKPKKRNIIPISINSKEVRNDKISGLSSMLTPRYKLSEMENLRKNVTKEKTPIITEWIKNFLLSGKKLVVFAYHRDLQASLIKSFPNACRIIAEDNDKERFKNQELFQNDLTANLIICSLKCSSTGINLTASSNVFFAEMGWCSAINDQAEDRCHRIGQEDDVNIWYSIAKNTIEEHIWKICENKRVVYNKIYDDDFCSSDEDECIDNEDKLTISIFNEILTSIENDKLKVAS